jgi:hypothetical protein
MEQAVPCAIDAIDFVTGFEGGTNVVFVRRKHDFHIYYFHQDLFPVRRFVDGQSQLSFAVTVEIEETRERS